MNPHTKPEHKAAAAPMPTVLAIFLAASLASTLGLVLFLSVQPLGAQYNLYYLLWKTGLRPYESQVALAGLFHDRAFRESLTGLSRAEFEKRFPSTFYQVNHQPPVAKAGEIFFISDFESSVSETGGFTKCWVVMFKDDALVEFYFSKG